MGRRTKEELNQANYYAWLEVCNKLRADKKSRKLTPVEKALLKTIPTPEKPYVDLAEMPAQMAAAVKKKKAVKTKIDFDKNVEWPIKGGSFLCSVYNVPFEDTQCILFCEKEECPFHAIGYFRSHGVKF
jgi:hypothetical protein